MSDKNNPWEQSTDTKPASIRLTKLGFFFYSLLVLAIGGLVYTFNIWAGLLVFAGLYTLIAYFRMRDWPDQKAGITATLLLPIMISIGLSAPQMGLWAFLVIHTILLFKNGETRSKAFSFLKRECAERWKLFRLKGQVKAKKRNDLIKQLESELQNKSE